MHQVQGNFEAQMSMFDKKFTMTSSTICETYRTYFILTQIHCIFQLILHKYVANSIWGKAFNNLE